MLMGKRKGYVVRTNLSASQVIQPAGKRKGHHLGDISFQIRLRVSY